MNYRTPLVSALAALTLVFASGCAVTRGQETVGAYIDDTGITTLIKSRFVENKTVDAAAIRTSRVDDCSDHARCAARA